MTDLRPACIVTGASRGIGAATAVLAARRGYAVAVNYLRRKEAALDVVRAIESEGGRAVAIQADVSDPKAITRLFDEATAELGTPSVLVNNAAEAGNRQPIDQIDPETVQRILAVTLSGPILCTAEAVRRMSTEHGGRGGVIVNVSSQAARTGGRMLTPYVGAKAGIEAITAGLARELGKAGIRVNAVSPGIIATDAQETHHGNLSERARDIPLGRLGTAAEVAEVIVWLMSDAASYVTGATIDVTGGR